MVSPKSTPPSAEYASARSRTASLESSSSGQRGVKTAPLSGDGPRAIGVSSSTKRDYKDRRIYLNKRTGLPVRPPTSFGLFKHALRRNIKQDKISFSEFNTLASEQWSKMSELEKGFYVQRARELADQYKKVEVRFLRKRVRQLQSQYKEYRKTLTTQQRRRRQPLRVSSSASD